jgi:signal transduction histidine kinase
VKPEPEPLDPEQEVASLEPELYHLVAQGTPWGFAICSHDGRLVAMNPQLGELFGLAPGELEGIRALGRTRAAHEALLSALRARAIYPESLDCPLGPDGQPIGCADEIALADGRILERHVVPAALALIGSYRDVTRRSRAEEELREGARQQAALATLGELAMNTEEMEPLLHAACATAVDVLGVDLAALLEPSDAGAVVRAAAVAPGGGATVLAIGDVVPGAAPSLAGRLDAFGLGAAQEAALPGPRVVGVLGAYARAARTFTPDQGRFLETAASILASALARRRAEEELLDRERQLRAVFDGTLDAMVILDDRGAIRDVNRAAAALFAQPRAELVGRLLDAVVPAARGWVVPPRRAGSAGEGEVIVPGQRPRAVEFAAVPGILPGLHLAVLRDVTERKQLHARLALADRMVSVGTLAAGVAHELNNPLAYVNANLSFLAERLARVGELLGRTPGTPAADADLSPQLLEAVRDARDGAERMRVIVRDLKTFSRADDERSGPVPLKPVIESCVNMAWSEIRHRAQLVKDLHDVPPVVANEARLGQVFLNLVVNAAQAIPEGRAEENEIRISTRVAADGRVAVEVRDTGCGIAPEHLTRVFDPFFTTKSPGVGTGLGLSICHSIVTALGGDITVESGRGGTLFRVSLPPAPADATSPVVPPSAGVRPRGRILVVDDEPLVGTVLQRTLSSEHDVTVVTTARAALEHLGAGSYDLVLSDLLMPEMSGMELYDALSRRDPALARKVVFLTGGAFTPAARAFLEREPVLCVEKPFELEAIRAVLARKLAELGD